MGVEGDVLAGLRSVVPPLPRTRRRLRQHLRRHQEPVGHVRDGPERVHGIREVLEHLEGGHQVEAPPREVGVIVALGEDVGRDGVGVAEVVAAVPHHPGERAVATDPVQEPAAPQPLGTQHARGDVAQDLAAIEQSDVELRDRRAVGLLEPGWIQRHHQPAGRAPVVDDLDPAEHLAPVEGLGRGMADPARVVGLHVINPS